MANRNVRGQALRLESDDHLRGLDTVRVRRTDVLKKLQENRDGHRGQFLEAIEGYHRAVISHLEAALKEARTGKNYRTSFALPEPKDHTKDYDRAITMLEMSLDEELELDETDFAQFVLDDWGWKPDFIGTYSTYTSN